jgi:hypothetical protein
MVLRAMRQKDSTGYEASPQPSPSMREGSGGAEIPAHGTKISMVEAVTNAVRAVP